MGSREIARFQILRILGAGAQGVVVLAYDHEDAAQQPVVLKVLQRPAGTDSLRQLQDEARILAWLSHPNIVKVHRLLEKDGQPIVVMEHVEGASTMEQLVRARSGLPPAVAVEVAHRAARALHGAWHARGPDGHPMRIVHRDVRPANLLVSLSGQVKVVDFGVALGPFEGADPTTFLGTPGYIAPERRKSDRRARAAVTCCRGAETRTCLALRVWPAGREAMIHRATHGDRRAGRGSRRWRPCPSG
jgi:serine/threonine protein kinase